MTLRQYLQAIRRRWVIVLSTALGFLVLGVIITSQMSVVYATSAKNFVSTTDGAQSSQLYPNSQYALNQVKSYTEIVHSPDVLQPVIDSLGLDMSVEELAQDVSASNPADTALIVVTARAGTPQRAQALANETSLHLGTVIEALETPRQGGGSSVKVTLAVPATAPQAPVSPRRTLNLALSLLLGLGLGAAAALIRDQLDTTVKSTADLTNQRLGVLGVVRFDPILRNEPLITLKRHGPGIEDFRTIRTNLQFTDVDDPPRQIVVSSAVAHEGKSVIACNLAIAMAQADLNVCLVEGDLRRPRVARYLGIDGALGLSDVTAGLYSADEVLVPWHRGLLTVLPAGTTPPDPVRLLGSHAAKELFEELRDRFDVVLIDAPPLLPVSDAALLGGTSDGVILVARHHHVRREQLATAISTLRSVNATIIGAVLNRAPNKSQYTDYEYDTIPVMEAVDVTPVDATDNDVPVPSELPSNTTRPRDGASRTGPAELPKKPWTRTRSG